MPALQDLMPHNHCFGCGPNNPHGLRIKSRWSGSGPSEARFTPLAHHCAGPRHFVNGGVLATLIDCHCVCTAAAAAYLAAGRAIGAAPDIHYATFSLSLTYLRPTPIGTELVLLALPARADERTYVVSCALHAAGKVCVEAVVKAVQVPESWIQGPRARA